MTIKNPFSIHDFLGYVFPGAFSILIVYLFYQYQTNGADFLKDIDKSPLDWKDTLLLLLLSYIVGHFVAYLSSLTIEKFSIWVYGYPSDYLLRDLDKGHYFNVSAPNCSIKFFWRIFVAITLLPIALATIVVSKLFGVKEFFVRKLDKGMINTINDCSRKLAEYLEYDLEYNKDIDFHRVISHYEYEVQSNHVSKFDNYVALYGFLRALSFIFNYSFIYMTIFIVLPDLVTKGCVQKEVLIIFCFIGIVSYLFFMGFMKFYRRYTLENFMCLIIDKSYRRKSDPGISVSYSKEVKFTGSI